MLGWARALGEFGATITFAGNYPGTTQTMPTLIYVALQTDPDAALALSLVLLLVSVGGPRRCCATAGSGSRAMSRRCDAPRRRTCAVAEHALDVRAHAPSRARWSR